MRYYLKNVLYFFLVYLGISFLISFFVPYHWGNPWYSTKIQYLEKSNQQFDTYFIGSSRFYRQIQPHLFDSTVNRSHDFNIKSFNLGAPGTFAPQTYYLYDHFLQSDLSKDVKYCFIELSEVQFLGDDVMHQERANYWLTESEFIFTIKSLMLDKNVGILSKGYRSLQYLVAYLEHLLRFGHFSQQLTQNNYYNESYMGLKKDGCYLLEDEFRLTQDSVVKIHYLDRSNELRNDPSLLDFRRDKNLKAHTNPNIEHVDKINLQRMLEMIKLSEKRGIKLVFIVSPRFSNKESVGLSLRLPEDHLIDMANPDKYPEYYNVKNSFDLGHMNTEGANQYSITLAHQFLKIID